MFLFWKINKNTNTELAREVLPGIFESVSYNKFFPLRNDNGTKVADMYFRHTKVVSTAAGKSLDYLPNMMDPY